MKKIISMLLLIIFLSSNFSFAAIPAPCEDGKQCTEGQICGECKTPGYDKGGAKICSCIPDPSIQTTSQAIGNGSNTPKSVMGISCTEDQLLNGQCKLNVYDTLGIRKTVRNTDDATSVGLFVQDVILSATFFIGTVVTVALIVSGLMYIFAASSGKDPANAKKGIIGSVIGLLLVVSSYIIIRLVQYIAKGF